MSQALFYISFDNNNFYTLVGGIKIINLDISKPSVETKDYVKDYRILIEGSGEATANITTSGLIDPNLDQELYQKFYDAVKNGTKLKCRLVKTENTTIEGYFIVQSIGSSMPNQETETFDLEFISTGEFTQVFT